MLPGEGFQVPALHCGKANCWGPPSSLPRARGNGRMMLHVTSCVEAIDLDPLNQLQAFGAPLPILGQQEYTSLVYTNFPPDLHSSP